jgi:hypothetical protein
MRNAAVVAASILLLGAAGSALRGAGQQTVPLPGMPTKPSVWVENRGADEAVPTTVMQDPSDPPLRVEVIGVTSVAVPAAQVLGTRHVAQPWEYRTVAIPKGQDAAAVLRGVGQDGWEAVSVQPAEAGAFAVLLKRPR